MGWSIGFDDSWNRDIGYGVPCVCDHPDCNEKIDRGLAHVCGGEPYGGDDGCGLFFCRKHLDHQRCFRCANDMKSYEPKPDSLEWITHKLTDASWQDWRDENLTEVATLRFRLASREPQIKE